MTTSSELTVTEGTYFIVVELGPPWPKDFDQALIQQIQLTDGSLTLAVNSLGQIIAELYGIENSNSRGIMGCPLLADGRQRGALIVCWKHDLLRIYVNKHLVGSTDTADVTLPSLRLVPPNPADLAERPLYDYAQKNKKCITKRAGRLRGLSPKPGRKLQTTDQMFESLLDHASTLRDLRQLLLDGKHHHVQSMSGTLRNLIADNTTIPLLQRCAAAIEAPLILYTLPNPARLPPIKLEDHFQFATSPERTDVFPNPIDLDIWLELNAGHLNGEPYTNLTLILAIAQSIGTHPDPSSHPATERMKAYLQHLPDTETESTMLVSYLCQLAHLVIALIESVAKHREANR